MIVINKPRLSPLHRGLTSLMVFDGTRAIDLVRNEFVTTVGTAFEARPQRSTGAVRPTAESSYWKVQNPSITSEGYFSIAAVVTPRAGGTFEAIVRDQSEAAGYIPIWATGGAWRSRIDGVDVTGLGTATNSVPYNVLVTASNVTADSNVYIDGTLRAGGVTACSLSALSPWNVNQNSSFGTGSLADFAMFAVWNRALRAAEAVSWTRDPWQLVRTRRVFIPVAGAAAAAPTLITASAINIGSTYATPRVTFSR